jgi:DNA-binding transcriptional ArsR family regulator
MQPQPLQPTLWRTARVIANRNRLQIFDLLLQQPDQTVSGIALRLQMPRSLASENLRALEARGLLKARRSGRWVKYRVAHSTEKSPVSELVTAMKAAFHSENQPVETIFKLATAFTHPRRIEIFRRIKTGPSRARELAAAARIPLRSLGRHLNKLEARRFVARHGEFCIADDPRAAVARALAKMAVQ